MGAVQQLASEVISESLRRLSSTLPTPSELCSAYELPKAKRDEIELAIFCIRSLSMAYRANQHLLQKPKRYLRHSLTAYGDVNIYQAVAKEAGLKGDVYQLAVLMVLSSGQELPNRTSILAA